MCGKPRREGREKNEIWRLSYRKETDKEDEEMNVKLTEWGKKIGNKN